jgi:hypothetical protein
MLFPNLDKPKEFNSRRHQHYTFQTKVTRTVFKTEQIVYGPRFNGTNFQNNIWR